MLSAVSLLLVGCANYDSDINRIDEELDRIENTRIKSLSEQIDRINVSLPELEQTDKDLKDMKILGRHRRRPSEGHRGERDED